MAPLVGQMGRCSVQREQRVKRREGRRGLGKGGDKSLTWELGTPGKCEDREIIFRDKCYV